SDVFVRTVPGDGRIASFCLPVLHKIHTDGRAPSQLGPSTLILCPSLDRCQRVQNAL
ncbi:hypothetical protein KIPB_014156, partial [Kipferlia bialata]